MGSDFSSDCVDVQSSHSSPIGHSLIPVRTRSPTTLSVYNGVLQVGGVVDSWAAEAIADASQPHSPRSLGLPHVNVSENFVNMAKIVKLFGSARSRKMVGK